MITVKLMNSRGVCLASTSMPENEEFLCGHSELKHFSEIDEYSNYVVGSDDADEILCELEYLEKFTSDPAPKNHIEEIKEIVRRCVHETDARVMFTPF